MTGNHIHRSGKVSFGADFGPLHSVTPIVYHGIGHDPHVQAKFVDGLRIDLTPDTAVVFAAALVEALAAIPSFPAQSVINILDGHIDDQISDEINRAVPGTGWGES